MIKLHQIAIQDEDFLKMFMCDFDPNISQIYSTCLLKIRVSQSWLSNPITCTLHSIYLYIYIVYIYISTCKILTIMHYIYLYIYKDLWGYLAIQLLTPIASGTTRIELHCTKPWSSSPSPSPRLGSWQHCRRDQAWDGDIAALRGRHERWNQ